MSRRGREGTLSPEEYGILNTKAYLTPTPKFMNMLRNFMLVRNLCRKFVVRVKL